MNPQESKTRRTIIRAAAIADGTGLLAVPGAILVESSPQYRSSADLVVADAVQILASGTPESIGALADADLLDWSDRVIIPALVNAHTHLDLTHLGPVPFTGDFVSWVEMVRHRRALDEADIEASVRKGIELSRCGGTAFVGDIAGGRSFRPYETLRASGLGGVSFLEVFGLGTTQARTIEFMNAAKESTAVSDQSSFGHVRFGLQPHAPYSCGIDVYRAAAGLGLPLATHLAETLEELTFFESASGPLADMLRRLGVWNDGIAACGCHPISAMAPVYSETPWIVAHVNYLDDSHIELMRKWPISVAYCPRASAYFGHPHSGHAPHRYRDMLNSGINVALGTDSIVCLDTPDRLSILDEMRFLHKRDGVDPIMLLRMATINGARALGVDVHAVTLAPGKCAGLVGIRVGAADSFRLRLFGASETLARVKPQAAATVYRS